MYFIIKKPTIYNSIFTHELSTKVWKAFIFTFDVKKKHGLFPGLWL